MKRLSRLFSGNRDRHSEPPQPQPQPQPRTQVRRVLEGAANTYDLVDGALRHMGVDGCTSSVGVYFKVNRDRCWVAHIPAYLELEDGTRTTRIDGSDAAKLRTKIYDRLCNEDMAWEWGGVTDKLRDSVRMVSLSFGQDDWNGSTGAVVVAAINRWLRLQGDAAQVPKAYGGLIVGPTGGVESLFDAHHNPSAWELVDQETSKRWEVVIKEGDPGMTQEEWERALKASKEW